MDQSVVPEITKGLSQESKAEALIDYIATTPQNINYNIVREILNAIINNVEHPYFTYYNKKMVGEETKEPGKPGKIDDDTTSAIANP